MAEKLVTKIFEFAAAHRLPHYVGECKNLHGHTYKLEVTIAGVPDPETGMIIDFSNIKKVVEEKVLSVLDHSMLNDVVDNPTAENLIDWIWSEIGLDFLSDRTYLYWLRLWETPTSYVEMFKERTFNEEG